MSTTAAMREVRRKQMNSEITEKAPKKPAKRKSPAKTIRTHEQNNNAVKRMRTNENTKDDMLTVYQPWVIQTYGDLAKTKTVTLKKYARILRTLRGDEIASADNSKFRFWVKAKGFCVGKPPGYDCKPADGIVGRYSVCDADVGIPPVDDKLEGSAKDPPLYVPNVSFKNSTGEPVYRKVAVVENFFDIIYNVHVDLEGRPGKHAGQKRTYRTITETYAFLPREAVTRFLLGCTECQKRPRSPSPPTPVLPTPSPSPTLPAAPHVAPQTVPQQLSASLNVSLTSVVTSTTNIGSGAPFVLQQLQQDNKRGGCVQDTGLGIERTFCTNIAQGQSEFQERPTLATPNAAVRKTTHPLDVSNLTSRDDVRPGDGEKKPADAAATTAAPKLWSPVKSIEEEQSRCVQEEQRCLRPKTMFLPGDIDYSMPITSTYLKYMRSLGCGKDEALDFDNKHEMVI